LSGSANTNAASAPKLHDCRDAFTATLLELAGKNRDIVAVCNDSVGSSKLNGFGKAFPERLINVGIAEQNLVGTGAGLANGGKIPFVCGASCFLTGRALEQIKADVAYSNTNVKLCGISAGMAYGELGPTHHSIEDFAWIRALPNVPIIAPADRIETAAATAWAAAHDGPVFLRLSRVGVPDLLPEGHVFELGRADRLRDGGDLTIIANGTLTHRAMAAAAILQTRGVSARVLNMATVRPIDEAAVVAAARQTGAILTCEEHTVFGGLGSAVAEVVVQKAPVPMALLGVPGEFARPGRRTSCSTTTACPPTASPTAPKPSSSGRCDRCRCARFWPSIRAPPTARRCWWPRPARSWGDRRRPRRHPPSATRLGRAGCRGHLGERRRRRRRLPRRGGRHRGRRRRHLQPARIDARLGSPQRCAARTRGELGSAGGRPPACER
jgi:transketolase